MASSRRGSAGLLLLLGPVLAGPAGVGPSSLLPRAAGGGTGTLRAVASWPRWRAGSVVTDPVIFRFSLPLDTSTVSPETFRVEDEGRAVAGTYARGTGKGGRTDERVLVFTPAFPLGAGHRVTAFLRPGLAGAGGEPLREPVFLEFRTSSKKETSSLEMPGPRDAPRRIPSLGPAPRVTWTFPAAGLSNVYSDGVVLRFSREMARETLDEEHVGIFQAETEDSTFRVPGTVTVPEDARDREVRCDPDEPLFPDSRFEMRVSRLVRSARGRFPKAEFRAPFGTSPLKGGVRPVHPEDFVAGPPLEVGRAFHTASALPSGDVVIAGGQTLLGEPLAATEVFRRDAGIMERLGDLVSARRRHAAAVLADGKVLVCGGFATAGGTLASAEVLSPSGTGWYLVRPMNVGRVAHTATRLPGGKVLVVGGYTTDTGTFTWTRTAEVYDPATDSWTLTGQPAVDRGDHTATLLLDGTVLVAGGARGAVRVAEIYDPATGTFSRTAGEPATDRIHHAAARMANGTVLLAGGSENESEVYDPGTGSFQPAGFSSAQYATLTPIPGGQRVALIGGLSRGAGTGGADLVLDSVMIWAPRPGTEQGDFYPMLFLLEVPRAAHTTSDLGDGRWLVAGGFGTDGIANERRTTIFTPSP